MEEASETDLFTLELQIYDPSGLSCVEKEEDHSSWVQRQWRERSIDEAVELGLMTLPTPPSSDDDDESEYGITRQRSLRRSSISRTRRHKRHSKKVTTTHPDYASYDLKDYNKASSADDNDNYQYQCSSSLQQPQPIGTTTDQPVHVFHALSICLPQHI